jgi:hypothetical protein
MSFIPLIFPPLCLREPAVRPFVAAGRGLGGGRPQPRHVEIPRRQSPGAPRSEVPGSRPVPGPHGHAVARLPGGLWALGRRVEPLSPLGKARKLAPTLGAPPDAGLSPHAPPLSRGDERACPSARRRSVKKNGGHAAQALGRSRGGFSPNIHAGGRDERPRGAVVLTAGHWHEPPVFETVVAQGPPAPPLPHAIRDTGYDSHRLREPLLAQDIGPVIPPKRNRTAPLDDDTALYK